VILARDRSAKERHDPVTHHLIDRTLVAVDRLDHVLENGVKELPSLLRIAVGDQLRVEPFMSAKSTVTCLRSPSRAALEVRIFSARCLGV
jgi:hypothetical protein